MVPSRGPIVAFLARWWGWLLFVLIVSAALVFGVLVPATPGQVVTLLSLVLGIAWAAFVPYFECAIQHAKETGSWLKWDHTYSVAPVAAFILGILSFAALFLFVPGAFERVSIMEPVIAAALGRAGRDTIHDIEKIPKLLK